jgi:hypothetical protein
VIDSPWFALLRIDVYQGEPECFAFQEVIEWGDLIVVGYGDYVHLVSPS